MKRILITGANSYIGESVKEYLQQSPEGYAVDLINTVGLNPAPEIFFSYDSVFNVAGIAHIKETKENRNLYYEVNRDLAVRIAKAAKEGGVKQFILLSTMSVYGLVTGHITKNTPVNPKTSYGDSKAQADEEIGKLENDNFKFACLRPPMVYGKGCKGNYQRLKKFTMQCPFFPDYRNRRSMIYIGNLCEFVREIIRCEKNGLFFPQNTDYVNTAEMVKIIAEVHHKNIKFTKLFNKPIEMMNSGMIKKVFGDLTYERIDVVDKYGFKESIELTEIHEM